MNAIFVFVEFSGKSVMQKKLCGNQSVGDLLSELCNQIVLDSTLVKPGTQLTVRYQRYDTQFDEYEDTESGEIKNGDKVKILFFEDETQEEETEEHKRIIPIVAENTPDRPDPPSGRSTPARPITPKTPGSVASKLSDFGFTVEKVSQAYRQFLFPDSENYGAVQDAISCSKFKEEVERYFQLDFKKSAAFKNARQHWVSACGEWLMENCQIRNKPTPFEKAKMAFSMWSEYPWFKSETGDLPYAHIYDPVRHTGFLENFCGHFRRSMKNTREKLSEKFGESSSSAEFTKNRAKKQRKEIPFSPMEEEAAEIMIKELNQIKPMGDGSAENKEIDDKMGQLLKHRRHWIHANDSVTPKLIMKTYNRFLDCPALILKDFESEVVAMGRDLKELSSEWQKAVPFILSDTLGNARKPSAFQLNAMHSFGITCLGDVDIHLDEELKSQLAFALLPTLLRPVPTKTSKKQPKVDTMSALSALDHIVQFKQVGIGSLPQLIQEIKKDTTMSQPFLLASTEGSAMGCIPTQMFLVVDYRAIELPTTRIADAINYLFASYFTFHTNYPQGLTQIFCLFELMSGLPSPGANAKATELAFQLSD